MKSPIATALLIGIVAFVGSYVALMGYAMLRVSYDSGPIPDLLYGIPIPLVIGSLAAMIAFRVKESI